MNTKLIATAFVTASLLGAPVIAYAQSESGQGTPSASTEAKPQAKAPAHHKMRMSHTHMKPGTTTGMSSTRARPGGESVTRKPAD